MDVLQYITQNYNKFTNREKLIADYLLKTKESIIGMSAKEIGEITGTSAPTVVRFAKKIGFDSLNEMKLKLTISMSKDDDSQFEYLSKDLSTKGIINGVKGSMHSIIDATVSLLKEEDINKAVDLLIKAKNIYIFSVGASGLVAQDFYYKLNRINKRCIAHTDTHLQITSSVLMEKGDVAIAISYSGDTKEVILCAENAKKRNIPVISITKASVDNTLANISDIALKVPYVEKSLREGAISSRISQLFIFDILFLGMSRNNLKSVEEKLVLTRNAVKKLKE
ncbi:MAG: MurR/RpiR family transcriptional regulator [Clostridium baratii]|uniref:MurR/RpiR family transcriptional regulator n=1 Tax=Clostridium baratii TaxID=1561 RepID=UPI00242ABAF6|nr:MurR/RpiR family transcriptional regulator [Clostridium baratii]MBS6041221.1 MurR/RpiR family transcriptional regulator [Clostridium baratii]